MKIGVTGASGFIGMAVAERLARAGHEVRGLVRTPEAARSLASHPGIEPAPGDIANRKGLAAFARGLGAVVHCAARTSEGPSDPPLSQRVNVDGTRNLLEVCREAGCRRIIHISSQSARPENPTAYGHTKWLSEELVRAS